MARKQRGIAIALLVLIAAAGHAHPASASEVARRDSTFASLTGIVLDSVRNEPLVGAQVLVSNSTRHATTGIDGRFRIDSIASGVHDIIVAHPFADSIGLRLGARGVTFNPGQQAKAAFAVPSERGLRILFCGENGAAHNRTILTGRVARVDPDTPAANATVDLDWVEVGFQPGRGIVNQQRHLSARTNAEGRYVFCNLADSLDASIRAVSPADSSGRLTVSLGEKAIGIQYLFLPPARITALPADSTAPIAAPIRGRVVDMSGRALEGATVDIIQGGSSTSTSVNGEFRLTSAPMGSQLLRVRHIGYAESIQPVMVSVSSTKPFEVALAKPVAALDPVVIRARLSDAAERSGFEKRARTGPGYYISQQFLADHKTRCVFDVIHISGFNLRRGMSICSAELIPRDRGYSSSPYSGAGMRDLATVVSSASIAQTGTGLDQCIEVFVDDLQEFPQQDRRGPYWQLSWLNPKSVVGIETYTRGTAPMRFFHDPSCALVLIWTSQYRGRHL